MEKEREDDIWQRKGREIFGEGKYLFCGGKKNGQGKGGNILKRKIICCGQGKGRKCLEKENKFLVMEETNGEEKGGNYFEKENQW